MADRFQTMTELLRDALRDAPSLAAIERVTGVKRQSMATFMRGETTMHLDSADKLAAHFGIISRRPRRRKGAK